MMETNITQYKLKQNNVTYILTTSLIGEQIKLKCEDNLKEIFESTFSMDDLIKLSKYFSSILSVKQVQTYLNAIIQKKRVGLLFQNNSTFY